MNIVGVHNGHHSNASIIVDGQVQSHFEAEKILVQKYVTKAAEAALNEIPNIPIDHIASTSNNITALFPEATGWKRDPFNHPHMKTTVNYRGKQTPTHIVHHHLAHAAYAFYSSPFDEALVLSYDGKGDDVSTMLSLGKNKEITPVQVLPFRGGMLFSGIGYYLFGMGKESGNIDKTHPAGKLMGLAPYGNIVEEWKEVFEDFLWQKEYNPAVFLTRYKDAFKGLELKANSMDVQDEQSQNFVRTAQEVFVEQVLKIVKTSMDTYNQRHLCIGGGCGLSGVVNTAILEQQLAQDLFVAPASHDGGLGIGAAQYVAHHIQGEPRHRLPSLYLGTNKAEEHMKTGREKELSHECRVTFKEMSEEELAERTAEALSKGTIIGMIRGKTESGPRALGNRSILASPLNPNIRDDMNRKVKHREWYRPFAPIVTEEDSQTYFAFDKPSPHMLYVADVKTDKLPGITHVDNTARLQTLNSQDNPFLYQVLKSFEEHTSYPILLNTSYNDRGQPILDDPNKIIEFFKTSEIDNLVVGNYWVSI